MYDTPFLQNCLLFTHMLRQAGMPIGLDQAQEFVHALEWIDLGNRQQFYDTARCLLVTRYEQIRLFNIIFQRFWRRHSPTEQPHRQRMPRAPRHRPQGAPFTIVNYLAAKARIHDPEIDIADKSMTYSASEVLQRKEFSAMSPEELAQIKQLIQRMAWRISLRKTRRRIADRRGSQLHLKKIVRDAAQHGGVPMRLAWQRRTFKQRPLILIADISGSMEKYARLLLQFGYSVSHSLQRVECFVFGTRLTRITGQLRLRNIDRAVDDAAREVADWAGGTRIGPSLQQFNQRWARRVLRRGAIVLLISDGWEQGDAALLAREMRFLQHRCHRLIWLNPLLGRDTYQPLVGGIRAALRYVDDFLPVHNLQSLHELAKHIEGLDGRRTTG